jgi:hypothetical protein
MQHTHTTSTWVNPHESDFELRLRHAREEAQRKQREYHLFAYDGARAWSVMQDLARVLDRLGQLADWYPTERRLRNEFPHLNFDDVQEHRWHRHLQRRFELHPAIRDAVFNYRPVSTHALVFEWPHVSETDPNRIAYTRDNRGGHDDRQVVTTVGKYLTRHFPTMPDHVIRDAALRYASFKFELWDTSEKIVKSVQHGPNSCMKWDDLADCEWEHHPYVTYSPAYGWRAAVRLDGGGNIVGRCLANVKSMTFVRSYTPRHDGYSHSDEALEVWLRDQGFSKAGSWDGLYLLRIENADGWHENILAPYLDGNLKNVEETCLDGMRVLQVSESGGWLCDRTDGRANEEERAHCDHCESSVDEDDLSSVGYHGDQRVCSSCIDDSYRYAYGRRGSQYYVYEDDAVWSEDADAWYHTEYLSDNNMVELHNGDVVCSDNAVYLESRDEYWRHDADEVVYCDHDEVYEHIDDVVLLHDQTYAHADNTWECHASGNTYHTDSDYAERTMLSVIDGQKRVSVHEDYIDEFEVDLDAAAEATAALIAFI